MFELLDCSFAFFQSVEEKCTYSICPETNILTRCQKQAWINSSLFGFRSILCNFGYKRFKKNAARASVGFEFILHKLYIPLAVEGVVSDIQKTRTEFIMDSAKRARELAKSKAERASEMAKSSAEKASIMAKSGAERAKAKVINPVGCTSSNK